MENPDGNPLPSDMRDLQNTLLGRYQIQKLLGRGGMGEVYLAQDTMLKRAVALKRLRPDREHSQEENQRIIREAQAASKLSNPRIASVYDVLEHQDEVLLVMEYVDGTSLRDLLLDSESDRLPLDRFFDIANQCAQALDSAHTAGLVHQDIKPDNIMVTESGQIKILDFGLAMKVSSEDDLRTLSTETFHERESGGTPSYMAPEAILGRTLDRRADIYSLGVTFYELLARERPFTKDSDVSLVDQVLHHDPIPLTEVREDIPDGLASVVQRMMAKDPEARYVSARDVLKDLVAAEHGKHLSTAKSSTVQKEGFWKSRTGAVVFALAGLILFTLWSRLATQSEWFGTPALPLAKYAAIFPLSAEDNKSSALALGMTEILTNNLMPFTADSTFQMTSLASVLGSSASSAKELKELLGVNLVLQGKVVEGHRELRTALELVDGRTLEVLDRREVVTPITDLGIHVDELSSAAAELLQLADKDWGVQGLGSTELRFCLEGMGSMRTTDSHEANLEKAVTLFKHALQVDPDMETARAHLGWAYFKQFLASKESAYADSARATCEAVLLANPDQPLAQRTLAQIHTKLGDREAAATSFEEAVRNNPTDEFAILQYARLFGRAHDYDRERAVYEEAIRDRPHAWKPRFWLANFDFVHGNVEAAKRGFKAMRDRAPGYYRSYDTLGAIQVMEGSYEEAVENLKAALALHPTEAALSNLGTAHFNQRAFEEAIASYRSALQFGFDNHAVWLNLADAYYYGQEDSTQAKEAYAQGVAKGEAFLAQKPYAIAVKAQLAQALPKLGEPERAREYMDEALSTRSTDPMIQFLAALTHWQLSEHETALDFLEQSIEGGYPLVWIQDSAVFDSWRDNRRFQALTQRPDGEASSGDDSGPRSGG